MEGIVFIKISSITCHVFIQISLIACRAFVLIPPQAFDILSIRTKTIVEMLLAEKHRACQELGLSIMGSKKVFDKRIKNHMERNHTPPTEFTI